MASIDLSVLRLETLEAIKRDCLNLMHTDISQQVAIEALENIEAVHRELDRRVDWANEALAALARIA